MWDGMPGRMGWNNGSHNDRCIEVKRKEEVLYSRDAI
jgi:hypothetical protein